MNILIVGATSGIGRALFEKLAKEDNTVAVVGRRQCLLDELCQRNPEKIFAEKADVTNIEEVSAVIERLAGKVGRLDLAIVCAGTGELNAALDYEREVPAIQTNVVGWTYVVDALYRRFKQQGQGHLVAITSVGGLRGEPNAPAYSATKAYQINYLEALRKKAFKGGKKVVVTDIRPGLTDTAMAKGEGLFWVMPVEKVASQILSAIRKKKGVAYVTRRWHVLALLNKNVPWSLYKRM
ncbi:MAG: SDR family NAD(P)-dependent oxidoreductase [Bacteroidaceae bacterium]|nr:SDR family NAD(P)-dependent oxidoreductase [Bacteroidaceae bacterium]